MNENSETAAPQPSALRSVTTATKPAQGAIVAELATSAVATAATVAVDFAQGVFHDVPLGEAITVLHEKVLAVQRGELADVEATLASQAVALNSIFSEMARRSAANMGQRLDACERYLRLALKAQNQCRATLETLAAMKNPPLVIARQANIAAGPQQVNNGGIAPARAGIIENEQNKLLEPNDGKWLDTRAPSSAIGADPRMAPLGAFDGPANG